MKNYLTYIVPNKIYEIPENVSLFLAELKIISHKFLSVFYIYDVYQPKFKCMYCINILSEEASICEECMKDALDDLNEFDYADDNQDILH